MGGLCQRILYFGKDISADNSFKKGRKEMKKNLLHENISEAVPSNAGLAVFPFLVLMLCGH